MPEMLDMVALRSLIEISEVGSFTAAARSLGLSQPAVSHHIRGLETRFGAELVTRTGRGVAFTAAGERVLSQARSLLASHDNALRSLENLEEPPIVIACIEHTVQSVLPFVLAEVEHSVPSRRVVVQVEGAAHISDGLATGSIDLGLVLGHDWDAPGDEVGRFDMRWVTARQHTAPSSRGVALVVSRGPCRIRNHALALLARAGVPHFIAAESSSLEGVLAATRAGLGTALLPMPARFASGLHDRRDLPPAGDISVRLVARRGADASTRAAATRGAMAAFRPLSGSLSA
jgi:molybdate transport repressor ModE-like protein